MSVPLSGERSPIAQHVAIIMDGNGRWAKRQGLPRAEGHRRGVLALKDIVKAAKPRQIKYLTVYAFSTENWRRPQAEIDVLMDLLVEFLDSEIAELRSQGVRLSAIGHLEELPERCQQKLAEGMAATRQGHDLSLTLALNYGSRREIVDAARQLAEAAQRGEIQPAEISDALFSAHLSTKDLPDPDLIIRPSGEWRLSNFLLWQAAYAEIYSTEVLWPDFDAAQLDLALAAFARRERRYGAVSSRDGGS